MCHAKDSADRPALIDRKIEITPEMTEAGVNILFTFNVREDDPEWIVGSIFEEMAKRLPLPLVLLSR